MHRKRRTVPSVGVKYRAVLSLIFFPSEKRALCERLKLRAAIIHSLKESVRTTRERRSVIVKVVKVAARKGEVEEGRGRGRQKKRGHGNNSNL